MIFLLKKGEIERLAIQTPSQNQINTSSFFMKATETKFGFLVYEISKTRAKN